jgi:hypothetical protein
MEIVLRMINRVNPLYSSCSNKYQQITIKMLGHAAAQMPEAICYKSEGRGFESRWDLRIFFSRPNPSSRNMALGSTQPLTEMSKVRPTLWADCLENVWPSTSHNPVPSLPVTGVLLHLRSRCEQKRTYLWMLSPPRFGRILTKLGMCA